MRLEKRVKYIAQALNCDYDIVSHGYIPEKGERIVKTYAKPAFGLIPNKEWPEVAQEWISELSELRPSKIVYKIGYKGRSVLYVISYVKPRFKNPVELLFSRKKRKSAIKCPIYSMIQEMLKLDVAGYTIDDLKAMSKRQLIEKFYPIAQPNMTKKQIILKIMSLNPKFKYLLEVLHRGEFLPA